MTIAIYGLFLLILAIACWKALTRPPVAMALLFLMWPIKQALQVGFPIFTNYSPLANFILAGVAGVCWLRVAQRGERFRGYAGHTRALTFVFILFTLASILWAPDSFYAVHDWKEMGSYVFVFLIFLPDLLSSEADFVEMCRAIVIYGTVTAVALFFYAQWDHRWVVFTNVPMFWDPGYAAFRYQFGNPLEVATLGMRIVLIVILVAGPTFRKPWAALRWPIVIFAVILMLRSGTRASIVDFAVTALLFFPIAKPFKNPRAFAGFIMVIAFLAILAVWIRSQTLLDARWSSENLISSTQYRFNLITASYRAWTSGGIFRFLFGYGFSGSFLPQLQIGWPEVGPAALVVDGGIVALVLWTLIVFLGSRSWYRCFQMVRHDAVRRANVAVLGALPFADFLLTLKGNRYFYLLGWCVFMVRYEAILLAGRDLIAPPVEEPEPIPELTYSAAN